MSTPEVSPDVTILMPQSHNLDRTMRRYSGLFRELEVLGVEAVIAETHDSYQDGRFTYGVAPSERDEEGFISDLDRVGTFTPKVVRDLTMPKVDKPIYHDSNVTLVHQPAFNEFVRDKAKVAELFMPIQPRTTVVDSRAAALEAIEDTIGSEVVVKPTVGSTGDGVIVGSKQEVVDELSQSNSDYADEYDYPALVQDFVETQPGIPELGVEGRHNYRVIMIGGISIFGFGRAVKNGEWKIDGDSWENLVFHDPEQFPTDLQTAVTQVQTGLSTLPDGQNTIVAADFMRGYVGTPEDSRMYLCELNRRPLRNSPWDGDYQNLLWAAGQWDKHEARLLAAKVDTL